MTTAERLAAREDFAAKAAHSESCAYIDSLRKSLATRPRGPVSDCDCWNGKILAALDDAEGKIAEACRLLYALIGVIE